MGCTLKWNNENALLRSGQHVYLKIRYLTFIGQKNVSEKICTALSATDM